MKLLVAIFTMLCMGSVAYSSDWTPLPQDSTVKKGMIYDYPEIMPQFPGGPDALDAFIKNNLKTPEEAKKNNLRGKVYVQFVVEKDGSVDEVEIRMGKHKVLNDEAIRLVKKMPDWKPGSNKGKRFVFVTRFR